MSLKHRINEDVKAAMRAKDAPRLSALRLLTAAIKQREVDERVELGDPEVISVIEKMLKQRRDSISQFESGGRQDLADKERFEVGVLQAYLPHPLSEAEVAAAVDAAIFATRAAGIKDMGKVMAHLKTGLAGRTDMAKLSGLVRTKLSGA